MKCYELAQETGWTPARAFEGIVDEAAVQQQVDKIHAPPPTDVDERHQQRADFLKMKCMGPKCSKRSTYNFDDQQYPKFCEIHKYEGMVDVTQFAQPVRTPIFMVGEGGGKTQKPVVGKGTSKKGRSHAVVGGDVNNDKPVPALTKGKGKAIQKEKKSRGRPGSALTIGSFGKDSKPITCFFSQPSQKTSPQKQKKTDANAKALLQLEQKLVLEQGLSRTEARHLAMATLASLEGARVANEEDVREGSTRTAGRQQGVRSQDEKDAD